MLRRLIIDKERDLEIENDLLGTKCYANQLADIIQNTSAEQAYTIGLYGRWGSGKSTIIKTAKHKLETENPQRIKVVIYDAWKYSGDSFRRMFLMQLQSSLNLKPIQEMERFYSTTSEELSPAIKLKPWTWWMFAILFLCIVIGLVALKFMPTTEAKLWTAFSMSFASLIVAMFGGGLFYELKVSQTKNILSAPEQFEDCFKHLMDQVFKRNPESSRGELEKLVIVIDNLDRCPTDVVYSMLTDIKSFLTNGQHNVVFVVPIDDGALKKHLFARHTIHSTKGVADADEFLRKFFNVVLKIKPHRLDDLLHYIHELNQDLDLEFHPNTLSLVAKEYAENPRCILQMLNNITVEQSLYDADFARRNETLIAACIIMREHYPQMVSRILNDASIIFADSCYEYKSPEADSQTATDGSPSLLPKELDYNADFKAFMRTAKLCLQNADLEDFRLILANTENALANISDEIKKALNSYDDKAIVRYIRQNQALRADIFIEIKRRIQQEELHGATDAMAQWTECIAEINKAETLYPQELREMDSELTLAYNFVPTEVSNADVICQLAKDIYKAGGGYLKQSLFDFIKDTNNKKLKQYADYVRGVLQTFTEKKDCVNLREWAESYMLQVDDISAYTFTETQKKYLLTENFVIKISDSLRSTKDESRKQLLIWSLHNVSDINNTAYNHLFTRLQILAESEVKSLNQLLDTITNIMPVLKEIRLISFTNAVEIFYNSVISIETISGGISHPVYMDVNKTNANVLAEFCFEMYRLSNRMLSINPCLLNIQRKCEPYVKEQLLRMKHEGINVYPFRKNILSFNLTDDAWYELLPVAFQKANNRKLQETAALKKKLHSLYRNRADERAVHLLLDLSEDQEVCMWIASMLGINVTDNRQKDKTMQLADIQEKIKNVIVNN